jgi:hypothetical protein
LVVPLPVCEIGLVACALFVAVLSIGFGVPALGFGVPALLFGFLVLFAVTLLHAVSYCETPFFGFWGDEILPWPPVALLMPGSLKIEPGEVAALPGDLPPLLTVPPQSLGCFVASAYAGAAPMTATATMQLAQNSLCLMFTLRFWARTPRAHPAGYTLSMGIWFEFGTINFAFIRVAAHADLNRKFSSARHPLGSAWVQGRLLYKMRLAVACAWQFPVN